ncbi:MAG: 23S rRNA (guanosine(2251)-2'-O)-methyltransferase RlmB [Natronospirillum sp.]|uniref:23S rRNA (guanosine-2'-O-)-methyltransferase RlmB n=1 Tax=Salinispirillum sp. LH 10-3-1 TaxID=2952525 RepID=A0AB38YEU2_9GAMM
MSAIAGIHAVSAALEQQPERVKEVLVNASRQDKRTQRVIEQARAAGVRFDLVQPAAFNQRLQKLELGDINHQGVIAVVHAIAPKDEHFLWNLLDNTTDPLLLILDGVTDPHNLGACLRTADAAGVAAVIVPKNRSAGLTPVVVKVASGAAEQVPLVLVTNLARTMAELRDRGVWLTGTAGETEHSIYDANLKGATGIVMGAEGEGMRRLTREHCDLLVNIPMVGTVSSLNVSVAAGVCLYEAVRQRL